MSKLLASEPAATTIGNEAPRKLSRKQGRAQRKAEQHTAQPFATDSQSEAEPNRRRRRSKGNKAPKARNKRLPGGEIRDISALTPEADDRPKKKLIQKRERPVLKLPMHRATTAHSCSIFPFGVHEAFGHTGAYLGQDSLGGGGAFFFDAFEAATRFAESDGVTNPNMMIFGNPGMGKSALLKTMLLRSVAIYGEQRFVAIIDVKGEYTPLAQVLGLPVVKLSPGGIVRVNPLEVRTRDEDRVMRLLTAASDKKLQVLDEAWRMLEYEAAARYLQSSWKLGRQKGLANIAAFHRPSNLASQANDGTATCDPLVDQRSASR